MLDHAGALLIQTRTRKGRPQPVSVAGSAAAQYAREASDLDADTLAWCSSWAMELPHLAMHQHPSASLLAVTALYLALQAAGLWQFAHAPSAHWPRLTLAYGTYAAGCVCCCFAIIGWLTVAGL